MKYHNYWSFWHAPAVFAYSGSHTDMTWNFTSNKKTYVIGKGPVLQVAHLHNQPCYLLFAGVKDSNIWVL